MADLTKLLYEPVIHHKIYQIKINVKQVNKIQMLNTSIATATLVNIYF